MSLLKQTIAVTVNSIGSIPQRLGSAIVTVIGVAGVVAVFVSVLSMASGFRKTLDDAGGELNLIVLRDGSSSELDSGMSSDQVRIIKDAPGLARDETGAIASAELLVVVDLPKRSTNTDANVSLRGVEPHAFQLREKLKLVEGRNFEPGKMEVVAGRGAASQFAGLDIGSQLKIGQNAWEVVGVFEADGGISESELWADVKVVQPAYRRGNSFASVYARLDSKDQLEGVKDALSSDPRLTVSVMTEREYYSEQSAALSGFIATAGYGIAILMALGAVFGTINTMYSTVSNRAREIGTLRALGFGGFSVVMSVMVESMLLSLIGGLVGGGLAYLVFNGFTVSTLNFSGFSQVVFAFAVTPALLLQGVIIALTVGLVAGLFPAVRAARVPITVALREG